MRPLREQSKKAGDGTRTRDIQLGKLTLYQLSYARNSRPDRDEFARRLGRESPSAASGRNQCGRLAPSSRMSVTRNLCMRNLRTTRKFSPSVARNPARFALPSGTARPANSKSMQQSTVSIHSRRLCILPLRRLSTAGHGLTTVRRIPMFAAGVHAGPLFRREFCTPCSGRIFAFTRRANRSIWITRSLCVPRAISSCSS